MKIGIVLHIQSVLIMFIGLFQIFPLMFSIYYKGNDIYPFIYSIILTVITSAIIHLSTRRYRSKEIKIRESFAIVTFGWVTAALFATIPFLIHSYMSGYPQTGAINNFTDAYFEMMSGFTTTGSSILKDIEALPKGLLFWRSLTHWLGGMGIILLAVAILPALGVGGMQLYQAEVPGPITDKIAPRISETAKILWGVYVLFTVSETILLMLGGMDLFDALCHTFGSVATGGFSTKNLSIGHYNSVYIDVVVIIFMFLSGANFTIHYRFLSGNRKAYFRDKEFLFYTGIIVATSALLMFDNLYKNFNGDFLNSIRYTVFQSVSIMTTTGYGVGIHEKSTYHFGVWSSFAQFLFIILMISGGSAGSTGGGVKSLRVFVALKFVYNEIIKFIYPRHIKLIRIGKDVIPEGIILSTLGFIMIHILITGIATLIMNYLESDLVTSFSSVVTTLNNVGPGLGKVGPADNFSSISTPGKWILTLCMLLGRLELYSVIILFVPVAWRKN